MDSKVYKSNNLLISAVIHSFYPENYQGFEKDPKQFPNVVFLFRAIDEIVDVNGLFYSGGCRVEPQTFYNSIKFLKNELNRAK